MNKQENFDYETTLDALLDYFRWLPKPTVQILNIRQYHKMMETAARLQQLVAETVPEGSMDIEIDQNFNLGSISIELPELSVQNPQAFSRIIREADNFELYPLTNGNVRLDITFQRILKPIHGKEGL